jgi:hypothetical protein
MSLEIPPMVELTIEEEQILRQVIASEPRVRSEAARAKRAGLDVDSAVKAALANIEHAQKLIAEYGRSRTARTPRPPTGTP